MNEPFSRVRDPGRRRRLRPGALLSLVVHLAAGAALLAAAAWRVDKLEPGDTPIFVGAAMAATMPPAGDEAAARPAVRPKRKPRVRRDLRSMPDVPSAAPDETDGETDGDPDGDEAGADPNGPGLFGRCPPGQDCSSLFDGAAGPVCGDGTVGGEEQCDDGNTAAGDGCSPACKTERETIVVSRMIEGYRVAGDPQIAAPDGVRSQMVRTGRDSATGSVKMCLGKDGAVRSLRILRSTGYPEYDELLVSRMGGWRYRPYRLDGGAAVPVCTVVTFIYRLE